MNARINNDGILEYERNGVWVEQMCIRGSMFAEQKMFCEDDCPLMGIPHEETDEDTGKKFYVCHFCEFEVGSESPMYEKEGKQG